jgi:MATE family multidrug resistance protein
MKDGTENWWNRPSGGRDVLRMGLPLVISTSLWTVMHFTDRMFLLWYSDAAVAAVMPAGLLHYSMLCFPLGVVSYVSTFVAQYYGAGQRERIGRVIWQAIWLAIVAIPFFLATIPLAPLLFKLAGHETQIAQLETRYYQIVVCGAGGTIIGAALSAFFTGCGKTRVVMCVDGTAALLNVVLGYAWIFGRWGFPAGGIAGAAWATVVCQWSVVLVYGLLIFRPAYNVPYQIRAGCRFDGTLLRRLLSYGAPSGLQLLFDVLAFTLFVLLIGHFGQRAMAATTLAFNINALAFVPMLGLGMGLSTIVGQQIGQNRPDLAARATWTALAIAMVYMGGMALAYVLIPDVFLWGHRSGTDPARFAGLRDLTVLLLRFVAAYCLFDALNVVFSSAVRGAGDTRFILFITTVMAPLPLGLGWIGIHWLGWQLLAVWWLITIWISALGLIYLARFLQGRWRQMRVIEHHVVAG